MQKKTKKKLDQVIADLDRHFGFATNYDGMMSELYKMKQELFESVSYFGIHLQRQIAAKAGRISEPNGARGLRESLKEQILKRPAWRIEEPSEILGRTS